MSHKLFVLRRFPKAVCRKGAFHFTVWRTPGAYTARAVLGAGWSPAAAWQDAFSRRRSAPTQRTGATK